MMLHNTVYSSFSDDGEDSWKVRYGALKSLARVCRYYSNDVTKDGVTNTAWSSLMQRESTESEPRVLEAMKIAKVDYDPLTIHYHLALFGSGAHDICTNHQCWKMPGSSATPTINIFPGTLLVSCTKPETETRNCRQIFEYFILTGRSRA